MLVNVDQAADLVRIYFAEHAPRWMLRPEALRVEYVPSPGGFGPLNFTVSDGHSAYHVKLIRTSSQLSAWVKAADRLAERYRAPRILAEIEIGGRPGVVLERLAGETPVNSTPTRVLDEIVPMLSKLHQDRDLAKMLGAGSLPARDTLLGYHITMCDEDLDEIEPALPPFVDQVTMTWMRAETESLRESVRTSPAFDEPVSHPIHGDLWFGNVLVHNDHWWVIDWDDLKIGDPAHDLSLILFTALDDNADASRWLAGRDAAFMERFQLYCRAALLTFVIDPLADWVVADSFPAVCDSARTHREGLHRWALARYQNLYGAPGKR